MIQATRALRRIRLAGLRGTLEQTFSWELSNEKTNLVGGQFIQTKCWLKASIYHNGAIEN
ncbi:hypothetical protein N7453_002394 [Penicillium expansum]|nr:hypothetical protein N7453_002394 [Penicillium expansum]